MSLKPPQEEKWNQTERWILDKLTIKEIADLNLCPFGKTIRSEFLVYILHIKKFKHRCIHCPNIICEKVCHGISECTYEIESIHIIHAEIENPFDSRNCDIELHHNFSIENSHFKANVNLTDIKGTAAICFKGTTFDYNVEITSVKIDSLDFENTQFLKKIDLSETNIGTLTITGSACSEKISLNDSIIGENLTISNSNFKKAIIISSTRIRGNLQFREITNANSINLNQTTVDGCICLGNITCSGPASINGLNLLGDMELKGPIFEGSFEMISSVINNNLTFIDTHFHDETVLYNTIVKGTFCINSLSGSDKFCGGASSKLSLRNTFVDTLKIPDSLDIWPPDNSQISRNLELDGFIYSRFFFIQNKCKDEKKITADNLDLLTDWLNLDKNLSPQPYHQLATVLKNMGSFLFASKILFAYKDRKLNLAWENWDIFNGIIMIIEKYSIGFGYGWRFIVTPIVITIMLTLIGYFVINGSVTFKNFDITQETDSIDEIDYSFKTFLPLIKCCDQRCEPCPQSLASLSTIQKIYFHFHSFAGFVLTILIIIGLIRNYLLVTSKIEFRCYRENITYRA